MITDAEFVLAKSFDCDLARTTASAQAIINAKNATLVLMEREVLRLRAELETERGRRRRAEFLLNRH